MKWSLKKNEENNSSPLDLFHRKMDTVFDDFFSLKSTSLFDSQWLPKVDVDESDKEFLISAELPGMDEKDISITLEKNILTISGEKKSEKEEKNEKINTYYTERHYGSFSRSISLPEQIKSDKVKAKFKKGILSVVIPKDEKAEKKRIEIEVH